MYIYIYIYIYICVCVVYVCVLYMYTICVYMCICMCVCCICMYVDCLRSFQIEILIDSLMLHLLVMLPKDATGNDSPSYVIL